LNFVGKFDAKLHVDGSGAHPVAHHHIDSVSSTHAPSDAIIVPDADLLFNGDFKRSGVDLIVSRDDHELVVPDYFKGEKRAALASPDGARLNGDIINALAGHVEYAQADGSAGAGKVIGHVTKLTGTATAIRNGVSIILNQGDNVEKGDVVQSGSGSTLGVTFIDGTVFGLSANARMVLNEMVYDPNGSSNSSLISLVAGTISFVAGQTAKHGDMKIDTPVATMGIRGTAVLVEIDFDVPGKNGTPEAKFQVLVEPDGNTGSYILFDKNTLAPIAIVDKAGQQVHISDNNVSFSDSPLTPELQKLITDVFTLKFSNTNPQSFTHFTDTLTPQQMWLPVQLANNGPPAVVHVVITPEISASGTSSGPPPSAIPHINQPPVVTTIDASLAERAHLTGSSAVDSASGTISFADINLGDRPTAKATISSFTYQDAQHQDIAASPQELADIQALEAIPLLMVQAPGNTYFGSATWHLNVPDKAFDFLGAGDTLTLTYQAEVDSNYGGGNLPGFANFTVTITGTNDAPVITTAAENVAFVNVGTSTPGPTLPPPTGPTTNTLKFKDVDLTDTHTVSADLTGATLSETGGQALNMQALEAKFPRPMDVFESALSAAVTTDSTGTGTGTITWTLADISSYYADIVPAGETLTLTYTVTVKDSQGATSSQKVIVTIVGSDAPAVVWVETTDTAPNDAAPGDWNGAGNWETGTVPIDTDDVIIITDQLQGHTPLYPVTIKSMADGGVAAAAHSVTMNDFGTLFTNSPTLINNNTLTVGAGGISLSADAILENFGTLSLSGLLEVLQESSLQNNVGGLITLQDGGDFNDSGSFTDSKGTIHSGTVTNSGTIEVAGGTLNVEVAVANAGGTIQVDSGATLKLNGAAIDGGTINDFRLDSSGSTVAGDINITGSSTISNAHLNNGTVTIASGQTLKLTGDTVTGTNFVDNAFGAVILIDGTVTLDEVTITGGLITNSGATLTIDANQTLTLQGGASLVGGTLSNFGTLDIESSSGATLDGVTVIGSGSIEVDVIAPSATPTLVLDDGTTITGGTLTVGPLGTLAVQTAGGATLNGVDVTNEKSIEVFAGSVLILDQATTVDNSTGAMAIDGTAMLTLNDASISGGTVTNNGTLTFDGKAALKGGTLLNFSQINVSSTVNELDNEKITNAGAIAILALGELTLDHLTKVDNTGGIITVYGTGTLALNDAIISGGTVNDFSTDASGKNTAGDIDIVGSSTISGAHLNNGQVTVGIGVMLTLDNDTVTGTHFADTASGATIQVDGGTTLKLSGVTINDGIINDFSADALGKTIAGDIDITGPSTISDATLNHGNVTVESGQKLTLDGDTVNGTAFANVAADSVIHVDGGETLTLNDTTTITGGGLTIGAGALVKTSGDVTLTSTGVTNDGKIEVTDGVLKVTGLVGTLGGSGSIQIDNGAVLDLNASDTQNVAFSGDSGKLQIDTSTFGGSISGLTAGDQIDLSAIGYGPNTTGIYSNGILTITDGMHSISMTLIGDYSNAHFAGSSDGHGGTLITLNASDDIPVFAVADKSESATVTELANTTGSSASNPSPAASGTLHFTDIDLTDRPTVTHIAQSVVLSDGTTTLSSSEIQALEHAFSLTQPVNTNNGSLAWTYQISDSSLDFLSAGEKAIVTSTITLDDHHGGTDTATVTITVEGANDLPTIVAETDPSVQTVILNKSPIVLGAGVSTNSLHLHTETFDNLTAGSVSNNGSGHGNFTSTALDATFTASGAAGIVHGSSSVTAAPFIGPLPGHVDTTNYLSIGAHASETLSFASEQNEFGLYWGRPTPSTRSAFTTETIWSRPTQAPTSPHSLRMATRGLLRQTVTWSFRIWRHSTRLSWQAVQTLSRLTTFRRDLFRILTSISQLRSPAPLRSVTQISATR
jgi:fibronectin-binding autotransporter adhesin